MSGWAGFTDADLKKLKGSGGKNNLGTNSTVRKQSNFGKVKPGTPRQIIAQNKRVELSSSSDGAIPPEQKLSNVNNSNNSSLKMNNSLEEPLRCNADSTTNHVSVNEKDDNGNVDSNNEKQQDTTTEMKEVKDLELDQSEALSLEMGKLEKYQQQQKMIEELNKQRKQLLSKAISERSKKAKAEAHKLNHIEKQLRHLDHLLTADVSLIRDRIEEASVAFMDAQKRYQKAEKEFVESKIDLHDKAERKEQLTEHLYTIIHQNEVRKAQKLTSLMSQLEMDVDIEEIEGSLFDLPPLTSFNSMQTLSPTHVAKHPSYPAAENSASRNIALVTETAPVDLECSPPKGEEGGVLMTATSEIESQTTDSANIAQSDSCVANNNDMSLNETLNSPPLISNNININLNQNSPDLIPAELPEKPRAESENLLTASFSGTHHSNPDSQEKENV